MTKKTNYITRADLEEALEKFSGRFWAKAIGKFALKEDFFALKGHVFGLRENVETVKNRLDSLEAKFDAGFANLDTYLKRSELWHDRREWSIR